MSWMFYGHTFDWLNCIQGFVNSAHISMDGENVFDGGVLRLEC